MTSTPDGGASATAPVVVTLEGEQALIPLAARLAAALPDRAFVAIEGDLGAGKTTFVKAVAAALGIDPLDVVSPTFGLIHVHAVPEREPGPRRLVHADFYRLASRMELAETGWDDATTGRCWAFIEWPDRIAGALPADRLDVTIRIDSETGRTFTFTPRGGIRLAGW